MASDIYEVEQALLALNQDERAAVIQRGIQSLETTTRVPDEASNAAVWATAAEQRLKQVMNDEVELLDYHKSHRQLRAELAQYRKAR